MPRGGARHVLSSTQRAVKHSRIEDCFKRKLSLRKACSFLSRYGRGYGLISVQRVYLMLGLKVNTLTIENTGLCLKVNTESKQRGRPRKIGIYDDNLQGYMLYFINAKLRDDLRWMAGDIRSECILSILTQDNLKHLSQYIIPNKMPYGKDLSLLKAIMFRQRLKHIEIETRREDVTVSYTEEYRREDDG